MSIHLTPVRVCERIIGPIEQVAAICGNDRKAGYHWRHASSTRSAGDFPTINHLRRIMAHAKAHELPLRAEWLIWGAYQDEVETAAKKFQEETGRSLPLMARATSIQEVAAQ